MSSFASSVLLSSDNLADSSAEVSMQDSSMSSGMSPSFESSTVSVSEFEIIIKSFNIEFYSIMSIQV